MPTDNTLPTTIVTYNNTQYIFQLVLFNDKFSVNIPDNIVDSIYISDSIYNVFKSIQITIINSRNAIDVFSNFRKGETNQIIENVSYNFLGGGNDMFYLQLTPKTQDSENTNPSDETENFSLQFSLVISDEDEVLDGDGVTKKRVFSCTDVREYILNTDKKGYSTINEPNVSKNRYRVRQIDNDLRRSYTGDFIKYLLSQSLEVTEPAFAEDWDKGSSVLFYTSPQNYSAYDDLDYMLSTHVSAVNRDNCLLKFEKNSEFSLRPYSQILSLNREGANPGIFWQDIFTYQDNLSKKEKKAEDNISSEDDIPKEISESNSAKKLSFENIVGLANFPDLPDYNFLNRTGIDGVKYLKSYAVHAYELGTKQFEIYQSENNIESTQKYLKENYISKFGGKQPTTALFIDEIRRSNINFESRFSLPDDFKIYYKDGRNRALQKYIDSSPSISFSVEGFTHRESARFMTLAKSQFETESVFANLFSGEWLVTQIDSIFKDGSYTQIITGVKLYYYDKITSPSEEDGKDLSDKINRINSLF